MNGHPSAMCPDSQQVWEDTIHIYRSTLHRPRKGRGSEYPGIDLFRVSAFSHVTNGSLSIKSQVVARYDHPLLTKAKQEQIPDNLEGCYLMQKPINEQLGFRIEIISSKL